MTELATTKMSSKGQVVIPEGIREKMDLGAGTQFMVLGEKDVVILKLISHPSKGEFDALIKKARSQAKLAGLSPGDVARTTSRARRAR